MFCRQCHYDLRGQVEPRCPECGRSFVLGDPETYDAVVPTIALRLRATIKKLKPARLVLPLLLYGVGTLVLFPSLSCGPSSVRAGAMGRLINVGQICRTQVAWHALRSQRAPDATAIPLSEFSISWSPQTERKKIQEWWRFSLWCDRGLRLNGVFLIGAGIITLIAGWGRIRLVGIGVVILGILVWPIAGILPGLMQPLRWPYTRNYLNDSVMVTGLDWQDRSNWPKMTITVFEKDGIYKGRIVGFGARGAGRLDEFEFQDLLDDQPLAKQAWDECVAAGACTTVAP